MARPLRYTESIIVRMSPGTAARIKASKKLDETPSDVVRSALERELARRARAKAARKAR